MGAGKSTVGPRLAQRLGCRYADTDDVIESASGRSVAAIFEREGEDEFRRLEREAIDALAGTSAVVSLGGGAMAEPGAPERLARDGTVVYLRASLATLLERVGEGRSRPLLRGLSPADRARKLEDLLGARRGAYESAEVIIDTDGKDVDTLVAVVLERIAEESA